MIAASELKAGSVIRLDGDLLSVTSVDHHAGGGQFGAMVFVKARSLTTQHVRELRLHPGDKLEDVVLDRVQMEYLYTDGSEFFFMNPETFDQISLSKEAVGAHASFLQPNMRVPVELYEGNPISVAFPPAVEMKVVTAPPPVREHDASTQKMVVLENGLEVLAPHFIKEGDLVKIEVATGKYLERVRAKR